MDVEDEVCGTSSVDWVGSAEVDCVCPGARVGGVGAVSKPSTAAADVERETEPDPLSAARRRLSPEPRRTSRRRSREGVPARSTEAKDVLRECSGERR